MRFREFDGPQGAYVQAAVYVPFTSSLAESARGSAWLDALQKRISDLVSLDMSAIVIGWRIGRRSDCGLRIIITAQKEHEKQLRLVLAGLALFDGADGNSITVAIDPLTIEKVCNAGLETRLKYSPPAGSRKQLSMSSGLRLFDCLDLLCRQAVGLDATFEYRISVGRFDFTSELRRAFARRHVDIQSQAGIGPDERERQKRLMTNVLDARFRIEEELSSDFDTASLLARAAQISLAESAKQFPLAEFLPLKDEEVEITNLGLPAFMAFGSEVSDMDYELISPREMRQICLWKPKDILYFAPPDPVGKANPEPPESPPPGSPETQPGSHFISYAHADSALVTPVLRAFQQSGVGYWYDTHIQPGAEWLSELEKRITSAPGVVAFISHSSAKSRYCRREIFFADIMNLPIYPMLLEETELNEGLGFILKPLQMYSLAQLPALIAQLKARIEIAQKCP
jgi:hypothetical protein